MVSIYSFLQKRKMHENQHGIIMVITAYVLSILMLVLGSDVFYNTKSAAAGIKTDTGEETKELNQTVTTDTETSGYETILLHNRFINPYSLTEIQKTGGEQTVAESKPAEDNTIWLLGNAMDNETFDNLMIHMNSQDTAKATGETMTMNTEVAESKVISYANNIEASATDPNVAPKAEDNTNTDTFSVRVASADKVITVSEKEVKMLERIVEAEASGEDMIGKILIVNVIFNRVCNDEFPDTVQGVIFQHDHGDYQFSPVGSGRYYDVKISKESKKAVQRALDGEDYSKGALYFIARRKSNVISEKWFDSSLEWLFKHGGHDFFKD